jgi:hypothetical protein
MRSGGDRGGRKELVPGGRWTHSHQSSARSLGLTLLTKTALGRIKIQVRLVVGAKTEGAAAARAPGGLTMAARGRIHIQGAGRSLECERRSRRRQSFGALTAGGGSEGRARHDRTRFGGLGVGGGSGDEQALRQRQTRRRAGERERAAGEWRRAGERGGRE